MQVSGSTYNNTQNNYLENYKNLSSETQDKARGAVTDIASNRSTQAQIDAYVAGSGNDTKPEDSSNTQAYVDFASDVRRANNYETFLNAGGKPADIIDKPVSLPVEPTPLERFQELAVQAKKDDAVNTYTSNNIGFAPAS